MIHPRIESAISTAKQWESDRFLLTEIRNSIPFEDLVPETSVVIKDRYESFLNGTKESDEPRNTIVDNEAKLKLRDSLRRKDDLNYEGDDLLLKRLTLYFKKEIMTWVNSPPCVNPNCKGNEDGKQMRSEGVRGAETEEEKAGQATRVEMYTCQLCNTSTNFPRYNSPRALFQSRRGRCGEFANLFGTYCRAIGFDTRYCLDLTDHVWVEIWSVRQGRWLHADSCEGLIDRPSMYEQGWGKKLSYVIGATHDSVADISKRYTRKFFSDEFQTRRRKFSPDENTSDRIFMQMNATIKQIGHTPKIRVEELEKRAKAEDKYFVFAQSSGVWDTDYQEGRISGSHAWKSIRGELGDNSQKDDNDNGKGENKSEDASFIVESFYPVPHSRSELSICVRHLSSPSIESIIINGVPCALTLSKNCTSIVIVDDASGCILQSRAFSCWSLVGAFIDTVPSGRIIGLVSNVSSTAIDEATTNNLQRIGGLINNMKSSPENLMFVGQVGHNPKWTNGTNLGDASKSVSVAIKIDNPTSRPKLRSEVNIIPTTVSTRLPETIMPLKTQIAATEYQKRVAFEAFINQKSDSSSVTVGYTTRTEAPIYLIGNESYPMRRAGGDTRVATKSNELWTTYHYLPDVLVAEEDVISDDIKKTATKTTNHVMFDVPVSNEYFMGLLGGELLSKTGASTPALTNTTIAIENTRLVALYFSAHWCGPCRGFTPMLSEFYAHLKEEVAPTHGLEIIFVSSDRSEAEFNQYFSTMPFKAVPFANRALAQQLKSVFGVRGIPSLVVLDALSGRIVVSQEESRREVHQACSIGEQAIERLFNSWLDKVPEESKSMLDILALSCEETNDNVSSESIPDSEVREYLVRIKTSEKSEDQASVVKRLFTELVAKGMSPNEAAAEAIKRSTEQSPDLPEGLLEGSSAILDSSEAAFVSIEKAVIRLLNLNDNDITRIKNLAIVAKKYVTNVQKDPTNPRFRTFRLGNKVFDQITSISGSIQLLSCLGFYIFPTEADFVASIPLSADLSKTIEVLDRIMEVYS